jgi:hypothetical protein
MTLSYSIEVKCLSMSDGKAWLEFTMVHPSGRKEVMGEPYCVEEKCTLTLVDIFKFSVDA